MKTIFFTEADATTAGETIATRRNRR